MMPDKRDECGCHRNCITLPHECTDKPCTWPACLTPQEEQLLIDDIMRDPTL